MGLAKLKLPPKRPPRKVNQCETCSGLGVMCCECGHMKYECQCQEFDPAICERCAGTGEVSR